MALEVLRSIGNRVSTSQEADFPTRLSTALEHISQNQLLTPADVDTLKPVFAGLFTEHGHLTEVTASPECQQALHQPRLERLNTGMGRAVVTALDGGSTYQQFRQIFVNTTDDHVRSQQLSDCLLHTKIGLFRAWATRQSVDLKGLKGAGEYSKRRGLEHLLADTIALSSGVLSSAEYAVKLNQRRQLVDKPATTSSIPKNILPTFYEFLGELCETPIKKIDSLQTKYNLTPDEVDLMVVMGLDARKPVKKT